MYTGPANFGSLRKFNGRNGFSVEPHKQQTLQADEKLIDFGQEKQFQTVSRVKVTKKIGTKSEEGLLFLVFTFNSYKKWFKCGCYCHLVFDP